MADQPVEPTQTTSDAMLREQGKARARRRVRLAIESALESFQLGNYGDALAWIDRAGCDLVDLKECAENAEQS